MVKAGLKQSNSHAEGMALTIDETKLLAIQTRSNNFNFSLVISQSVDIFSSILIIAYGPSIISYSKVSTLKAILVDNHKFFFK